VLACETRPLLQGARLTVWELARAGAPHRLCVDSAGPAALATGRVDAVVVGADRIAANGDVANKIGTYMLACAAARSGVPFLVVAPEETIDPLTPTGAGIVVEERDADEVTGFGGVATTLPGTPVFNPAFDVTPYDLVDAVVTEARAWSPSGNALGPDAAEIGRDDFRARVGRGTSPIKARLLDQAVLSGVGNLLADETLWQAKVDPHRPAGSFPEADLDELRRVLRKATREAITHGGVHTGEVIPHRRRDETCPRCGAPMERGTVGGRTTWWCSAEQTGLEQA